MNRAVLERRLDAIATEVAALQPKAPADPGNNPFAWLAWLNTGDLMWIEGVIEHGNLGIEPTPEERRNGSPSRPTRSGACSPASQPRAGANATPDRVPGPLCRCAASTSRARSSGDRVR